MKTRQEKYLSMTRGERRFHDVTRQICVPLTQAEIYRDLTEVEKKLLESGTNEDVERRRRAALKRGVPIPEERSLFDWLIGNGFNNITRLAKQRGTLPEKLALDYALEHGLLNGEAEHRRLLRECVGEDIPSPVAAIKYVQNELQVNGKVICSVRPTKLSKLNLIFESFDEIGWRESTIDFSRRYNSKQIRDAVRQMNNKQNVLVFHASLGSISWAFCKTAQA